MRIRQTRRPMTGDPLDSEQARMEDRKDLYGY